MKLLISPTNVKEALIAAKGGADIIDVKNPLEGSLGANYPWVIKEIITALPKSMEISATLGDLDFKPGTASLAALGLGSLGVNYVKAGLYGISNEKEAIEMGSKITRALRGYKTMVILAGYAEFKSLGSISPYMLPDIAIKSGASGVMIDTAIKNGESILDHLKFKDLQSFVDDSHSKDIFSALAGSIKIQEIPIIKKIDCDILGVRSLVCTRGDRLKGSISEDKVRLLINKM